MVTEVSAFQADDGSIHDTRIKALEHDALMKLKTLDQFNHASALALITQAADVVAILEPIVLERQPKTKAA